MSQKTNPSRCILASTSPRREDLFKTLKIPFSMMAPTVEEIIRKDIPLDQAVQYIAYQKAQSVAGQIKEDADPKLIISADTIVVLNNEILGKPTSKKNAVEMLSKLSRSHCRVMTGYCILNHPTYDYECNVVVTHLKFKNLPQSQIENYVNTGDPMDKAGAFGIQGHARQFIEDINGDIDNVIGLPISYLKKSLAEFGIL